MNVEASPGAYIKAGWALCQFPSGTKGGGSLGRGWNLPERAIRDPKAIIPGNNIGLLHTSSGTCAFDLDVFDRAGRWLEERGFDLAAALDADDAVQINSGRPNKAKLLYRLPEGIDPTTMRTVTLHGDEGEVLFELRCATADGKSVQDVLPPSIHPETGKPYRWVGDWRRLPPLPAELLAIWRDLMAKNCPETLVRCEDETEQGIITPRRLDELGGALDHIPADDYATWVAMGHALKTLPDDKGLDLWLGWSATSTKFREADARKRWATFRPNSTGYAAVFAEAQRHGWQNPRAKASKVDAAEPRQVRRQIDLGETPRFKPTEFVLDGFMPAQACVIAGAWGAGKSTNLIPLLASAAHLSPEAWGFRPHLRRHVVWITEAPEQALDTLLSLQKAEGSAPWSEFKEWFHLFPSLRRPAKKIAEELKDLVEELTWTTDTGFRVKPALVLDTTSANLDLENESDNSQVGAAMSVLKQTLPATPLVLIGHTPKALLRADVSNMSFRGAGAWEAEAAATYYLVWDEDTDQRFLAIRKARFSPTYREIDFKSEGGTVIVDTPWGEPQSKSYLHGVPTKSNGEARQAARREAIAERAELERAVAQAGRQEAAIRFVRTCAADGEVATTTSIRTAIGGDPAAAKAAIEAAVEAGEVIEHPTPGRLPGSGRGRQPPHLYLPPEVDLATFWTRITSEYANG